MTFFMSVSISLVNTPPLSFSSKAECCVLSCSVLGTSALCQDCKGDGLQRLLPCGDLIRVDLVEHTVDTSIDEGSHDLGRHAA